MPYAISTGARYITDKSELLPGEKYSETPDLPPADPRKMVEAARLQAYADPITGSDRYFSEAARLLAMGGTEEQIEAAQAAGAARSEEIQAMNPWP